jgi:Mrp family chromosome partitioning ATPase
MNAHQTPGGDPSDLKYRWMITTYNNTIIPTDPMTSEKAEQFLEDARAMRDAGFFTSMHLVVLDEATGMWLQSLEDDAP